MCEALRRQRDALLRDDAEALSASLQELGELTQQAARWRAAEVRAPEGGAAALARELRELARGNAQLLVRARDRTKRLLEALREAPAVDRRV
ncbi:MAG: hypothetical protein D6731_06050 [Planctomycetota bacterium]|nr:MAG: hypothetical protein D6731_06050 [Planctomycetota bacterium]